MLEISDLREKSLKSEKRIISGVQNLDIMRFIVGRFTPFSPEIEFLSSLCFWGCWENNVMWWVFVDQSADRTNILRKSLQTMSPSSFRIYVTDFISSIYNLKTVFRADLINFQICTLSNLRLVSYLIFIEYQKPILHQIILLRLIIFDLARCQK